MLKLLNVDAAGERALRVVAYFDQLGINKPDLDSVVRATALIADCTAGIDVVSRGLTLRYSTEGNRLDGSGVPSEPHSVVTEADGPISVWIEREGPARDLDEFITERFALTAAAVVDRERSASDPVLAHGLADPALAQLLVNDRTAEAERSRAAQLIGIPSGSSVQLIALEPGADESLSSIVARLREALHCPAYSAELSRQLALVVVASRTPIPMSEVTTTGRAAAGPVVDLLDAPRSWALARVGLRFAGAGSSWPRSLDAADLGVLRLLATLDPSSVAADPDIVRLERLANEPHGAESITILDHFLHADSIRSAAREMNFHHSSLQTRVRRIGEVLEIDLKSPAGRERAAVALLLWRTAHSN